MRKLVVKTVVAARTVLKTARHLVVPMVVAVIVALISGQLCE